MILSLVVSRGGPYRPLFTGNGGNVPGAGGNVPGAGNGGNGAGMSIFLELDPKADIYILSTHSLISTHSTNNLLLPIYESYLS